MGDLEIDTDASSTDEEAPKMSDFYSSPDEVPAEYWQIQKLVKYIKVRFAYFLVFDVF